MLQMSSTSLPVLCQHLSKTQDSFVGWTYAKLSHILLSVNFRSETVVGFGQSFQKAWSIAPQM